MAKKFQRPKSVKDIKGKVALDELRRAHWIITILSAALAFVIVLGTYQPIQFDTTLGAIATVLLIVVAAVSATVAIAVGQLKK